MEDKVIGFTPINLRCGENTTLPLVDTTVKQSPNMHLLPMLTVVRRFWDKTYMRFEYSDGCVLSTLTDKQGVFDESSPFVGQRVKIVFI